MTIHEYFLSGILVDRRDEGMGLGGKLLVL